MSKIFKNPLKGMINPIDYYTSIDDLLRKEQLAILDLTTQTKITNTLLLAFIKQQQASATTGGAEMMPLGGGAIYTDILKTMDTGKGNRYATNKYEYNNKVISGQEDVINMKGGGLVAEALFMTVFGAPLDPNQIFGVKIQADSKIIYNNSFVGFKVSNGYESEMTAFSNASYNCVRFINVAYNQSIYVQIYSSTATFTRIMLKIHERIEGAF